LAAGGRIRTFDRLDPKSGALPRASDIAHAAASSAKVLEAGCGPGHLSIRLPREHALNMTGLDLDPAMIERAGAPATLEPNRVGQAPMFVVGDVAALPFDDAAFDLVVSTLSMHHWSDLAAGLREIHRVLRPGGKALIWDLRPGFPLLHVHAPDPTEVMHTARLAWSARGPGAGGGGSASRSAWSLRATDGDAAVTDG
jgi:ubiquinone/menaquinone biosynthesis C-methylase UbiE